MCCLLMLYSVVSGDELQEKYLCSIPCHLEVSKLHAVVVIVACDLVDVFESGKKIERNVFVTKTDKE